MSLWRPAKGRLRGLAADSQIEAEKLSRTFFKFLTLFFVALPLVPVRRKLLRPPARYAWMRPSAHRLGKHLTRSEPADGNSEARNSGIHRILAQARSADEGAPFSRTTAFTRPWGPASAAALSMPGETFCLWAFSRSGGPEEDPGGGFAPGG